MSHLKARRKYGACYGTLWKQHTAVSVPPYLEDFKKEAGSDKNSIVTLKSALDKNERGKSYEFCVLVGNSMFCYENLTAFRRGDHPTSDIRIVGASAWNPPQKSKNRRSLSPSPPSLGQSNAANSSQSPTFRLLTHAGTHIYCSAQSPEDRSIWLSALHSGLEITYAGYEDALKTLQKLQTFPKCDVGSNDENFAVATPKPPKSLTIENDCALEPMMLTPPSVQRGSRIKNIVRRIKPNCNIPASPCAHNIVFLNPYESSTGPISKTHCLSCGRYPPDNAMKPYVGTPLPQYGMENRINICHSCLSVQGMLRHMQTLVGLYASDAHERVALMKGRDIGAKVVQSVQKKREQINTPAKEDSDPSEKLEVTPEVVAAVTNMINEPSFSACRRRSSALDHISTKLENGAIGSVEFLELLNEYSQEAIASSTLQTETIQMKKEALMIAGDMRAAIKMLHEHALPKSSGNGQGVASSGKTEMLSCILEFLLDLCEQGELSSVAFFWPQLCQIHLQMLPATDSESLARIELVEDFLLTVCSQHSVHLALEIVWSCIADLEESFSAGTAASPSCRRRRFALMRFICELESLIFDHDGGWGGGVISMRGMYSPSDDQTKLMKQAMGVLQLHRRFSSHHLSRSARLDKLNSEAAADEEKEESSQMMSEQCATDAAKRKLRIARSAEYFSTQLMFCRRLGDIAEKLRFMDVDERAPALEAELEILNASGRLGGDPLNNICKDCNDFVNVLKIPKSEGHVFRSKERTPVLLLTEIRRDGSILTDNMSPVKARKMNFYDGSMDSVDTERGSPNENGIDQDHDMKGRSSGDFEETASSKDILGTPKANSKQLGILRTPKSTVSDAAESTVEVENMVAEMVKEKLKVSIPDLTNNCSSQSFKSCGSELSPSKSNDAYPIDDDDDASHESSGAVTEQANELDSAIKDMVASEENHEHSNGESIDKEAKSEDGDTSSEKSTKDADLINVKIPDQPTTFSKANLKSVASAESLTKDDGEKNGISLKRKVSAFGSPDGTSSPRNLAAHGEGRRQVLTAMFTKGQRSSNIIARGVAPAARRAVQAMDRRRAQRLINRKNREGLDSDSSTTCDPSDESWNTDSSTADQNANGQFDFSSKPSEEDECVEAIRLLLVQNSVAMGKISPENAARAMNLPENDSNDITDESDAGKIDARFSGCGSVSSAVLSALELWKQGQVSHAELLDLVQKDLQYTRLALPGAENESKLQEDSVFWGRFAFGERWAEKKARIQASSVFGAQSGWDMTGVIVKSNDDLRQEAFAMQLIELCTQAFELAGLELWTYPYRILATGRTTGIIEMVRNSMSIDSLKKRPGYAEGGLKGHFKKMAKHAADPKEALKNAKKNFIRSLAAYSLLSYLFEFKDRHNGNLLLDTAGHVIHIDFGFIFGIAPGGSFSLEQSVPFKLTEEMIQVMDGLGSVVFSEFVTLFCCGFLALQEHCETFVTIVDITCEGSTFKCFEGKEKNDITSKLRERFCPNLSKEETISHAMELIRLACNATGTKQYDFFQYMSQGIAA